MRFDVPIPPGAEERAHGVVMGGFSSYRPPPRRRSYWKAAIAIVVVAAAAGVLASPPGRSVITSIRRAVGVEKAQRELFSLPAPGRLLVNSPSGPWVVRQDGEKRLLGPYREASWSPFGRFVVAVRRRDELVTMEPDGKVHWTLARPDVSVPAWGGRREDTRIAYRSGSLLRVVAGDGTDDAARCGVTAPVAPVWQPGSLRVLAVAIRGHVAVQDVTTCRVLLREAAPATKLEWSSDGKLLLAVSPFHLRVFDLQGRVVGEDDPSDASRDADAAFLPGTHEVAVVRVHGAQSDVFLLRSGLTVFHVIGALRQVVSSPDGRWLLLTSPAADQWIFVRTNGSGAIRAYSGIAGQFGGGAFPTVSGWIGK